jgi:hypothetical protein
MIAVVNRASRLRLRELDVSLRGAEVRRRLGRGPRQVRASGVYVVVTLTVRNRLRARAAFGPEQVQLLLGRALYDHSASAEAASPRSFLPTGGQIRRGGERTGTVAFDVPRRAARRLQTDGNVVILQYGDASYERAYSTVGVIRTYR